MTLTLRAVSLNEQPLTQTISAHFDANGGTIGRHDDNTLALPDPERHISRRQAEIRAAARGYTIRNVGSANPIVIRGQPLARGESTALAHRDQVRIGGYLLEVIDEEGGAEASAITQGRASVEANVPTPPTPTSPPRDPTPWPCWPSCARSPDRWTTAGPSPMPASDARQERSASPPMLEGKA